MPGKCGRDTMDFLHCLSGAAIKWVNAITADNRRCGLLEFSVGTLKEPLFSSP